MKYGYSVPDGTEPQDRGYPRHLLAAVALMALVLAVGCGRATTPEDEVRVVIAAAERAAEARDVSGVSDLLTDDFRDARGAGRSEARNQLRGYFIANQSVHLVTRVDSVEFAGTDVAPVRATVAMAGREQDPETAFALSAGAYEFDVTLVRESGDWKVSRASWRRLAAD